MAEDDIRIEDDQNGLPDNYEELNLDNMGGEFIKNPKVGEEIQFIVARILKNKKPGVAIDPATNKPFKTSLSSVDYSIEIRTVDDKVYSPKSWEIVGKLKAGFKHLNSVAGVEVKIAHLLDGMVRENRGKEIYSVSVRKGNTEWYKVPTKPKTNK